jgi:preprotein translocase subunit SecE
MAARAASATEKAPGIVRKIVRFFTEAYAEMLKVIWPTFDDVRKFTVVVLLTVVVIAIFIYLCDVIFGRIALSLYGLGQ